MSVVVVNLIRIRINWVGYYDTLALLRTPNCYELLIVVHYVRKLTWFHRRHLLALSDEILN